MSRGAGWETADVSTRYFNDPKLRRLRLLLDDPSLMGDAVCAHFALVLGSWGDGRRLTLEEAAPGWLTLSPALRLGLRRAGLIDAGGRLPKRSWDSWYGPAARRRELARESGAEGNRRRWGSSKGTDREPVGSRSGRDPRTEPISTDRQISTSTSSRARARKAAPRSSTNGPTSLRDALAGTPLGQAIAARSKDES